MSKQPNENERPEIRIATFSVPVALPREAEALEWTPELEQLRDELIQQLMQAAAEREREEYSLYTHLLYSAGGGK